MLVFGDWIWIRPTSSPFSNPLFSRMMSAWLFSQSAIPPSCTLHGHSGTMKQLCFQGNAWIQADIQDIYSHVILMETVLENTVPRAIWEAQQQAWLLFGVMGPFCLSCALQDYLMSRAALHARRSGAFFR